MFRLERCPDVSVVVPACWPPARLACCLAALRAQTLNPQCYEILVVDPGRDDALRQLVKGLAARARWPRIRYLRAPGASERTAVHEAGLRAAQAPVVAFADDRAPLRRDWLRQGLSQLLLQPGCGMVDALVWRSALQQPVGGARAGRQLRTLRGTPGRRRFFDPSPPRRAPAAARPAAPAWLQGVAGGLLLLSGGLALASWPLAAALSLAFAVAIALMLPRLRGPQPS
jgi:hypothetical protein